MSSSVRALPSISPRARSTSAGSHRMAMTGLPETKKPPRAERLRGTVGSSRKRARHGQPHCADMLFLYRMSVTLSRNFFVSRVSAITPSARMSKAGAEPFDGSGKHPIGDAPDAFDDEARVQGDGAVRAHPTCGWQR